MVAVVVGADDVAVLVEREILRIAQTAGEDLLLAAVEIGAPDHAAVRVGELASLPRRDMDAEVALLPVEPSIGADEWPGVTVAAEPDVHSRAVRQRFLRVDHAIAIRVAEAPEVGGHR